MIQAVLFDWGDTVMRVFPEYDGPMVEWPRVEAMPGIAAALEALQGRYRVVLATNAAASGATLVWAALQRVGLEKGFFAVFTAHELGLRKPDPAFFQAIVRALGVSPQDTAMVGDDYRADVAGAKAGGLRAVWYNPSGAPCPALHPLHDAEASDLAALPAALESIRLPDLAECLRWLSQQDLAPQVERHSYAVAGVAFRIAEALRARGLPVDPLLAHRGGLLHDLAKLSGKRQGRPHGTLAGELLRARGYPDLAAVAERHVLLALLDPASPDRPVTWEEKVVHYADKIVSGETLVGLPARLDDLCRRYPDYAERIRRCEPAITALEAEICSALGTTPAALLEDLRRQIDAAQQGAL